MFLRSDWWVSIHFVFHGLLVATLFIFDDSKKHTCLSILMFRVCMLLKGQ